MGAVHSGAPDASRNAAPPCRYQPGAIRINTVVIGEVSSGKTSLIKRFVLQEFETTQPCWRATTGFYSMTVKVDKWSVNHLVFDSPSTRKFLPVSDSTADAVVVCLDLTDSSGLDRAMHWFQDAVSHGCKMREDFHNAPIVLVGTKCDLVKTRVISREAAEELCARMRSFRVPNSDQQSPTTTAPYLPAQPTEATTEEASYMSNPTAQTVDWKVAFSQSRAVYMGQYHEVSAKTGEGVDEVFQDLAKMYLLAIQRPDCTVSPVIY